jgi:peptidyl-prolyl cis-trans isomerase A (cyclophilin A)
MGAMSTSILRRFALSLALLTAPALVAGPGHAAPSEAEIQARIEAELARQTQADEAARAAAAAAALEAQRKAEAAAAAAPPAPPDPAYRTVMVVVTTSFGPFTLAIEEERAPVTSANFLAYVDQKRLDGTVFYRSFKWDDGTPGGFIQGGTQNDPKRILKPVPHEPTSNTGLSHTNGAISMAQAAPGTATGDFFIIVGDMKGFDATATQPGFAAFGRVVAGMEVIRQIADAPRSPTKGEGVMKGQMLEPQVKIITARRAPMR